MHHPTAAKCVQCVVLNHVLQQRFDELPYPTCLLKLCICCCKKCTHCAGIGAVGETLNAADLTGEISLLNVWATWCPSCIAEHGELTRIFETTGLRIIGVNYNDDSDAARAWLKRWGDPYAFHIVDEDGTLAIDLGVYGAPETFVVDAGGIIRYRHVGVVTQKVFEETFAPLIQNLKDAS